MSYLSYPTNRGSTLINLDGIRRVDVVRANPTGGSPRSDRGRITYEDGTVMEVPMGCAMAVQNALKSKTIPLQREPGT